MTKDYKLEVYFAGVFFCLYVLLAIFNASEYFVYFSIVFGLFGLIFAWKIFENIDDQPEGDDRMVAIAETIHDGAMVFLSRKYRVLFYFIAGFFLFLLLLVGYKQGLWIGLCTAIAFTMGAISSLLVGFFGVNAAASASARTAQAVLEGDRAKAFGLAFNGGSVVGLCVVSLGLAGIGLFFLIFARGDSAFVINGYALGASCMALFARIAGSIYSNAAEISLAQTGRSSMDLKDTNISTLTANIGVSLRGLGLSADIFESYVGAIIAAIAIGATSANIPQALRFDYMALPLLVSMAGLMVTIAGIRAIPLFDHVAAAIVFRNSALISAGTMLIASLLAIKIMGLSSALFIALFFGCLAGVVGGWIAEYSEKYPLKIDKSDNAGITDPLIAHWSAVLESPLAPIVIIAVAILCAANAAGLYGVALAAVGLLGTSGITVSINARGILAENADGIAKIAELAPEARKIIDDIKDINGSANKGFMVTVTAITALALFGAYVEGAHIKEIDIANAGVLASFFLGASIPFLTASLAMKSVGRLSARLKDEIGFSTSGKPDTACHIDHDAQAAIKEAFSPCFVALALPVLISLAFGKQALGALLLGCILMGVGLILLLENDGIWSNAKYPANNPEELTGNTTNPLKDTCAPAISALIKTVAIVSLALLAFKEQG